jgi:hypothetical protein
MFALGRGWGKARGNFRELLCVTQGDRKAKLESCLFLFWLRRAVGGIDRLAIRPVPWMPVKPTRPECVKGTALAAIVKSRSCRQLPRLLTREVIRVLQSSDR